MDFSALEFNDAVAESKKGAVLAYTDLISGLEGGAALTDDNVARSGGLSAVQLDSTVLGVGIAAVLRRALSFFMSHDSPLLPDRASLVL